MKQFVLKSKLRFLLLCLLCLSHTIVEAQIVEQTQKFSHDKKINLIISLTKKRIYSDPFLKQRYEEDNIEQIEKWPEILLMSIPEATIVSIVQTYWMIKHQTGASDREILDAIERHRKTLFPESGPMPSPLTLSSYIKYRLNMELSYGVPISSEFIDQAIKEANEAYR
jgi:hypothetical protein